MRKHFRRLDFNKDGVISRTDIERMAERFADLEGFSPAQKETIRQLFSDVSIFFAAVLFGIGRKMASSEGGLHIAHIVRI